MYNSICITSVIQSPTKVKQRNDHINKGLDHLGFPISGLWIEATKYTYLPFIHIAFYIQNIHLRKIICKVLKCVELDSRKI